MWDATCPDISGRVHATSEPGRVAEAEERKSGNYWSVHVACWAALARLTVFFGHVCLIYMTL